MYTNINYELYPLEWDERIFGVRSLKVILKNRIPNDDWISLVKKTEHFVFITYVNINNNPLNNKNIVKYTNAYLTDVNAQLKKETVQLPQKIEKTISISAKLPFNKDIMRIASNVFMNSRFYNDPFIDNHKAGEVYTTWVKDAFEVNTKYFACIGNNSIKGFVLFSVTKENTITIELIGVDPEYIGQGIGQRLMTAIDTFAYENKVLQINVGTQVDNIWAINFYYSCGYKLSQRSSVYHQWIK